MHEAVREFVPEFSNHAEKEKRGDCLDDKIPVTVCGSLHGPKGRLPSYFQRFIYLLGRQRDGEMGKEREIEKDVFHPLMHSLDGHSTCIWARPKPGTQNTWAIFCSSSRGEG